MHLPTDEVENEHLLESNHCLEHTSEHALTNQVVDDVVDSEMEHYWCHESPDLELLDPVSILFKHSVNFSVGTQEGC